MSAQWRSSTKTTGGRSPAVAASTVRARPSRNRALAPGSSSEGVGGVPSSGTIRAASEAAGYITGASLDINGGDLMM